MTLRARTQRSSFRSLWERISKSFLSSSQPKLLKSRICLPRNPTVCYEAYLGVQALNKQQTTELSDCLLPKSIRLPRGRCPPCSSMKGTSSSPETLSQSCTGSVRQTLPEEVSPSICLLASLSYPQLPLWSK